MRTGTKWSCIEWKHVSIWVRQGDWDKISYMGAASGKTLSAWILERLMSYEGVPPLYVQNEEDIGKSRSLCFPKDKWEIIKERANSCGMTFSQYVISVIFA